MGSYAKFQPGFRDEKAEDELWRDSGNKANMVKHKVITFAPVTALETLKAVSLLSNGMLMMKKIQRQSKTMQNSFEELIPVTGLNC